MAAGAPIRRVVIAFSHAGQVRDFRIFLVRPAAPSPRHHMPDREAMILGGTVTLDSGLVLEQDRA